MRLHELREDRSSESARPGYARVSTRDHGPALQLDALREAGCERTFRETASGAQGNLPELAARPRLHPCRR